MIEVVTLETSDLGDRSYVVHDGTRAAIIDPQRDVDRVLDVLERESLDATHVLETHIHNDYVTGGLDLARRLGAEYVLAGAEDVAFERTPVGDGTSFSVGDILVTAVRTPGHTPEHLSYAVGDGDDVTAVFTGGSLLYGAVGRTDLLGEALAERLTREQYRSAHRLAGLLDDDVSVYPTHGFGSFCVSGGGTTADASTIGAEREANLAFITGDEEAFVRELLGGMNAYPRYYAHMGPRNRRGPEPVDLSPPPTVSAEQVRDRAGDPAQWVVDVRRRKVFAAAHTPGAVNVEADDSLPAHLGWALPWGTPITLLAPTADVLAGVQRSLARIGIDRPAGGALGDPPVDGDLRSYAVGDFAALADAGEGVTVLDVRRRDEWDDGHLRGARHVPFFELPSRLAEVSADLADVGPVWVHCASGSRATIAASLLDGAGVDVVLIDDTFSHAARSGLEVVTD